MTTPKPGIPLKINELMIILYALFLFAAPGGFAQGPFAGATPGQSLGSSSPDVPSSPREKFWVKKVVAAEYRVWYIRNDSTIYGYNNGSPYPVPFPIGGRKVIMGAGGFNVFRVLDDEGYLWSSKIDF